MAFLPKEDHWQAPTCKDEEGGWSVDNLFVGEMNLDQALRPPPERIPSPLVYLRILLLCRKPRPP